MSSVELGQLLDRHPDEAEAIARLQTRVLPEHDRRFSVRRLVDLLEPESKAELLSILRELVQAGLLERIVAVVAPHDRSRVVDVVDSFGDAKPTATDPDTDEEFVVTPNELEVFYRAVRRDGR